MQQVLHGTATLCTYAGDTPAALQRLDPVDGLINQSTKQWRNIAMMNFGYNGLMGVLLLAGDIWAILNIAQSSASNEKKLIWILVVLLLPLLGLILWFFLGPRNGRSS